MRASLTGQRLVALFLLGALLLNYPLLALFAGDREIAGLPLGYAWLFGVWGALILAAALFIESGPER